jgi:hypothetical protein
MPMTTAARHLMLDAYRGTNPTTPVTHNGLMTKQANKSVTATTGGVFTSTSHGFAAGDVVVFSGLTGGNPELVAGDVYYVIATNLATNTFSIAKLSGGTLMTLTNALSAGTVNRLVEISGGSPAYSREAITFAAASNDQIDDSTNGQTFDVPAAAQVDYVSDHSALTTGTLLGVFAVTQEIFAAQGQYVHTDAKRTLAT